LLARSRFVTLELSRVTETWQHTHVGRFRVEGVLGRGGMGVVLRAFDPHLQRLVAIKVLTERKPQMKEGTTVNLRERVDHDGLLDEARALAQITDPNVLAVHEIGNERGQTFLVMELVEGADLRQWLGAAPRSLAQIYSVFAQAARGLAAAHRRGIIHRDFKPENVLISADGRVRVCDFGIAAFARSSDLIHTGTAGTPRYMAPELWRDQGASVQSDVYAFAATLVEAIAGELVSDPAMIDRELAKRGVDARARAVLTRALDPDIAKRPSSIDEITRTFSSRRRPRWLVPVIAAAVVALSFVIMTIALRSAEHADAVCGDAANLLAARWNDRERASVRSGIAATGATPAEADEIIARLDEYAKSWQRLRGETCKASVAAAQRPGRLACLDRRLFELSAVVRALHQSPRRELALGRSNSLPDLGSCIEAVEVRLPAGSAAHASIEELTAKMVALYDQGLATPGSEGDQASLLDGRNQAIALGDIELAVRIDRIRAQLLVNAAKHEAADKVFEEAYQLALQHHQDSVAALALVDAATNARHRGDLSAAESKLRIAKIHVDRAADTTPFGRMKLYREVAATAADRGEFAAAHDALTIARAAVARMEPRDPLWIAELVLANAELLAREGKLVDALQAARASEAEFRRLGSQGVADLSNALMLIGDLERQRGKLDTALQIYNERVDLLARTMPPENSARVFAEGALGNLMLDAGRFDEAKAIFARTVDRIDHTPALAGMHADFLNYTARAERMLGNFERARVLLQNAIDEERRAGRNLALGVHEVTYAYLELDAGDIDRAALHARAAEELLSVESAEHVDRLDIAIAQAAIAMARGKPDVADQIASRILALFEERKIDDARNERFWLTVAAARSHLGRPREALELATRAVEHMKARNAPELDVVLAEAEQVLATYLIDKQPDQLTRLRRLVMTLDDPRTRIDHARFVRWFEANHLRP
jgi:eukaryotic-like serine/threonine-protein kinase